MDLKVSVEQLGAGASTGEPDDIAVVTVVGEVDVASVSNLDKQLQALSQAGTHRIIVDLGAVGFIDSAGLGVLVKALKEARAHDGWLRVVSSNPRVTKVFSITGLDTEVNLSETVEQAAAF